MSTPPLSPLSGVWLGQRAYPEVLALQEALHAARRGGLVPDVALFVEHPAVITFGRGTAPEHLLASAEQLRALGIECAKIGRGGDITLHAPGQLVGYPIVALELGRRDVRRYVTDLAGVMADVVRLGGVDAGTLKEHVGLWVDLAAPREWPGETNATAPAKIGAIGVRISRWVTMHGFALNLANDLGLYRLIVPCGIRELGVTSLSTLIGSAPALEDAARQAFGSLCERLGRRPLGLYDLTAVAEVAPDQVIQLVSGSRS